MKTVLYTAMHTSKTVQALEQAIASREAPALLTGPGQAAKAMLIGTLSQDLRLPIVLTGTEAEASKLVDDLQAIDVRALVYPARELSLNATESASHEYEQQRLAVLGTIAADGVDCVVATAEAAAQFTLPPDVLRQSTIKLTNGAPLPVPDLPAALTAAGYERAPQVESAGQFSVRGGIVDVFPAAATLPVRLELWGDTIDSLARFDPMTQRRDDAIDAVSIPPVVECLVREPAAFAEKLCLLAAALRGKQADAKDWLLADAEKLTGGGTVSLDRYLPILYDKPATLFDHLPDSPIILTDWSRSTEELHAAVWRLHEEIESLLKSGRLCQTLDRYLLSEEEWRDELLARSTVLLETFARSIRDLPLRSSFHTNVRQLAAFSGTQETLYEDLRDLLHRNLACILLTGGEPKGAELLAQTLGSAGLPALFAPHPNAPVRGKILVTTGWLSSGVEWVTDGVAVLTCGRGGPPKKRRLALKKYRGKPIGAIDELRRGDYVVHAAHGIGVYLGIEQVTMNGLIKDYIKLEYAKGDLLYVPVTQLDLVSKYIGTKDGGTVRLHKLGGVEWQKAKTRVRTAVRDIAKELIALYSKRMSMPGYAFEEDAEWQYDFERHFMYEETEDQLRCADEIRADMQRPVPMDRLLCGDVGFGKTEVALRAAFRCVSQCKQCVILVPTTILAYQHYHTVLERFEGFPVKVEMISRFRTPKEQADILRRLERGDVDILIGTHRLLAKDVKFCDLGLFIVDEEQRFGVSQKEKIKERYPAVDVLTLSATPIPRTLNMAMSGIRDMSVIEEAPSDRHPVQTYVLEHDNAIVCDAIRKEMRRGGQVYYLHNRVDTIERCAAGLQMRLPEARIGIAHGRMGEEELSEIWRQVLEQEIDILVCTTIIETGIDVPNVNTLIIENADCYGLSQLHQLRGRVGRSSRRAYAYLTFRRGKVLDEVAVKRLEAMREFTEFGAGFQIAMRDMEIRGAGNLLGAQQHGHMETVGYDMYLRLLADAVAEEKGETTAPSDAECLIDLPISAHIPESYIAENAQRLDIYRRIAGIRNADDSLDVYDELIDRFGEPPAAVQGLVEVALLRNMAAQSGITEIKEQGGTLLLFPKMLDLTLASALSSALKGRVMISAGSKPYYAVKPQAGHSLLDALREALEAIAAFQAPS
ncbi:MAG: transcription-repair coupling factor [Clostridia bacterium]|nr:transcription-repair coupling factor [Clostridia bacterium]